MTSVLFVVSAADHWTLSDGSRHPTGYWAEELAVPHRVFSKAGWDITIATPGGRPPTLDRLSLGFAGGSRRSRARIERYLTQIEDQLAHPISLENADADTYDLVFYPGGHGPMEDLAVDPVSGALLTKRLRSGKPLALLCHAPAALLAATDEAGDWPFAGYRLTALSNVEERLNSFARNAPWLLEDRLRAAGAKYRKAWIPLRPFVVVDRNLYTGQNPASARELAERIVAELSPPAMQAEVARVIKASPERLYDFVSDVTNLGLISPENLTTRWIEPGRRFEGENAIGRWVRWTARATVTEATPGKAFAFLTDSPSETHWRYTFTAVDGGTLVTESMRKHRPQLRPIIFLQDRAGVTDRRRHLEDGMRATLDNLASMAETG